MNVYNCSQVTLEHVQIYGGGNMAFVEWGGPGGHTYRNVTLQRRPNPPYPTRLLR